jgi:hypothetical protein
MYVVEVFSVGQFAAGLPRHLFAEFPVNVTQLAMASNCIILLHKVCHPMIES